MELRAPFLVTGTEFHTHDNQHYLNNNTIYDNTLQWYIDEKSQNVQVIFEIHSK